MIISNGYRVIGGAVFLDRYTAPATGTANVIASPAAATVDEDSSVTINISGSNITDGTYYWSINDNAGTGLANIADFTEYAGSFNIVNNSGSFTIIPKADLQTEDSETVSISIRYGSTTGTVLTTATLTINDTSITPTIYVLTPSISNVDEGNAVTFTVTGSNIPTTLYYWTVETNAVDFTTKNGSFIISSNSGTFDVTPPADNTPAEGTETFTVAVRSGSTTGTIVATSDAISINDTSTGIYGSYRWNNDEAYLYIPNDNATDFAQRRFTTEFWILFPTPTLYSDSGTMWPIAMAETGYWGLSFFQGQGQIAKSASSSFNQGYVNMVTTGIGAANVAGYTPPTVNNVWNHYALVGDGANIKLYVNGSLAQFVSGATTLSSTPALSPFQIHTSGNDTNARVSGSSPEAYIFDYRHVKNTVYTGNFTRPTGRLSRGGNASIYSSTANVNTTFSTANTVLLLQTYGGSGSGDFGNFTNMRFWDNSANAKTVIQALYYLNPPTDYATYAVLMGGTSPRPF
jgi:hypothetical protein